MGGICVSILAVFYTRVVELIFFLFLFVQIHRSTMYVLFNNQEKKPSN